jgi:hypothetical protein
MTDEKTGKVLTSNDVVGLAPPAPMPTNVAAALAAINDASDAGKTPPLEQVQLWSDWTESEIAAGRIPASSAAAEGEGLYFKAVDITQSPTAQAAVGSDEPVHTDASYQALYHDAHHYALVNLNQTMSQLSALGWSPVEIVEWALDYFDVEANQDLLDEIAKLQAVQKDEPTEYSPEVVMAGDRGEADVIGCPSVTDWDETRLLRDGNEILTTEHTVTILFNHGLPNVTLHSDHGFTKRAVVNAICRRFQAAHFKKDRKFLEVITVDRGLVTFRLGS